MPFLSFLVILLFGSGLFFLVAYLLRKRMRPLSKTLMVVGVLIGLFLLALWLVEESGWHRDGLYKQLSYGLQQEELKAFIEDKEEHFEQSVFMLSLAATALDDYAALETENKQQIGEQLAWMAAYISDEDRFSIWKDRRNWEQQLFFLTHASIILGHYQHFTKDEQYSEDWTRIVEFIATGISRSKYKHMASRPKDVALRTSDNAAALYAISLYDAYHQTNLLFAPAEDWTHYIRKELYYEHTKLPCAGFSETNRCRLSSVGSSLAILNVYAAETGLEISTDFWREFRHYYKTTFVNVFGWIDEVPSGRDMPDFCDFSVAPLRCKRYENAFALYAAALRKDWITYYQLNNASLMDDLLNPPNKLWSKAPQEQLYGLISIAARLAAASQQS